MTLPHGAHAQSTTHVSYPTNVMRDSSVRISHLRIVLNRRTIIIWGVLQAINESNLDYRSWDALNIHAPHGEKQQLTTSSRWPMNVPLRWPLIAHHNWTRLYRHIMRKSKILTHSHTNTHLHTLSLPFIVYTLSIFTRTLPSMCYLLSNSRSCCHQDCNNTAYVWSEVTNNYIHVLDYPQNDNKKYIIK